jgi:hypothetical protein
MSIRNQVVSACLILACALIQCAKNQRDVKPIHDNVDSTAQAWLQRYGIVDFSNHENVTDRVDKLMVMKSSPFDTSCVFIIKKLGNRVNGMYYRTTQGDRFLSGKQEGMLLFDGVSFTIDSLLYKEIKRASRHLSDAPSMPEGDGCLDCSFYAVYADQRLKHSYINTMNDYEQYVKFLYNKVISPTDSVKQRYYDQVE